VTTTEADRYAEEALALLNSIKSGEWIPPGLTAGGGLAALDATMRPVDDLPRAGLDWLVPHVQPLQSVLDRLAGQAAVIQSFADAWQRAADKVEEIRDHLSRTSATDTAEWLGPAADAYRGRARELELALQSAAAVSAATGIVARQMGEVVADARRKVNELLTDLVQRLISYARQAIAAEGGVTPNVVSQCTNMINSYREPIAEIERKLEQAMDAIRPPTQQVPGPRPISGEDVAEVATGIASITPWGRILRLWRALRGLFGRRGAPTQRPPREVTEAEMIRAIRESPRSQIGRVEPPGTVRPGENIGNVMHDRVERVVRERWPDVEFRRTPLGAGGPDMPVTGRRPGSPDPGFDWVEIKPNTDTGIEAFVRREWGTTPAWSGRGRLVTYDGQGNVFEIHFPATTHP
jgi:hypothetical protein